MNDIIKILNKSLEEGKECILYTVIETGGTVASKVGMKMLYSYGKFYGSVGGGVVEYSLINMTKNDRIETKVYSYELKEDRECGGYVKIFVERLYPKKRIVIFGGGHCGKALSDIAKRCGFSVVVYDEREEIIRELKNNDIDARKAVFSSLDVDFRNNDYVVIMTPSHKWDSDVLEYVLKKDNYKYVGMMGSFKKCKEVKEILRKNGIDDELLEKVHCPIGLDICSHTPYEIAISVMAQIIKIENCKEEGV